MKKINVDNVNVVRLTNAIKELPIPDDKILAACKDILRMLTDVEYSDKVSFSKEALEIGNADYVNNLLLDMFVWDLTSQGHDFWNKIYCLLY